jgi:hypothetical protein
MRLLEQPQTGLDVLGEQRRPARAERSRNRALAARLDVELRERKPRALLRQRACRRR